MSPFVPGCNSPDSRENCRYVLFSPDWQLLGRDGERWQPFESLNAFGGQIAEEHYLGLYHQQPCFAVRLAEQQALPPPYRWCSLRGLLIGGWIDEVEFNLVSGALQVFYWDRDHQYCGRCGSPTRVVNGERARLCEQCELQFYPRISPCVITVIERQDELLLAHNVNFPAGLYSALAGFIETGEAAEDALRREVYEEVGIEVGAIRYFASQSWPFPGQLMIGYHAEYASGEIVVDGREITDARWYHYQDLPLVPGTGTLSGKLINDFLRRCTE